MALDWFIIESLGIALAGKICGSRCGVIHTYPVTGLGCDFLVLGAAEVMRRI